MLGGEHTKERFSERLQNCQNQPKNRGYLPGTKLLTGGYSTTTLQGRWYEERCDASYYDGKAALPPDTAKLWTSEYRRMTRGATGALASPPFDQSTMVEIVDRTHRAYPAHQPHLDTQRASTAAAQFVTTAQQSFPPISAISAISATSPVSVSAAMRCAPPALGRGAAQAGGVVQRFQQRLRQRLRPAAAFPGDALRQLRRALQRHDTAGRGALTVEETRRALAEVGVDAEAAECRALSHVMDTDDAHGTVAIARLVAAMRGEMRDRRFGLTEKVYELLRALSPDGIVRMGRLVELVDVDAMAAVVDGSVTSEAARRAFAEQWDLPPEAYVSFETFLAFFTDVSFEVEVDQDFEVLMRNIWHLSGGNGKSMNTSCRRVKVVHKNGRVTTQEVKNDLDIKDDDPEMMARIGANLVAHGIKDAAKIEILPKQTSLSSTKP